MQVWLFFFGWELTLLLLAAAVIQLFTIIGIPTALNFLEFAKFTLWCILGCSMLSALAGCQLSRLSAKCLLVPWEHCAMHGSQQGRMIPLRNVCIVCAPTHQSVSLVDSIAFCYKRCPHLLFLLDTRRANMCHMHV